MVSHHVALGKLPSLERKSIPSGAESSKGCPHGLWWRYHNVIYLSRTHSIPVEAVEAIYYTIRYHLSRYLFQYVTLPPDLKRHTTARESHRIPQGSTFSSRRHRTTRTRKPQEADFPNPTPQYILVASNKVPNHRHDSITRLAGELKLQVPCTFFT